MIRKKFDQHFFKVKYLIIYLNKQRAEVNSEDLNETEVFEFISNDIEAQNFPDRDDDDIDDDATEDELEL